MVKFFVLNRGTDVAKVGLLFLIVALTAPAADFNLSGDGVGPISVHTKLTYEGKGEHLIATATNDSGVPLSKITFCVTAATKDCLFTFWNAEEWEPAKELSWDLIATKKVRFLDHTVTIGGPSPKEKPLKAVPAPIVKPLKPMPRLEHGIVISQDLSNAKVGAMLVPIGTSIVGAPIYRRSNIVVVKVDNIQYTWAESGKRTIVLLVNAEIEFYREGNWFIVSDSEGNQHKFSLIGAVSLVPPAQ